MRRILVIGFLALSTTLAPARAQEPGSELTVTLVTIDQGKSVYELFGHNAIWIRDAARGTDIAYNWGTFDFKEPGFVRHFLQGYMMYWTEGYDMGDMLRFYQVHRRSVHAQQLNLSPAQKRALQDYVLWNQRPENKYYRYDYYRDNCSTRVRDVLDRALGGALRRTLEPRASGSTYRSETKRMTASTPNIPLYTGLLLAMGPNIDRPLSAWDESFIPMELREWVREVKVTGPDGKPAPLVLSESTLYDSGRTPPPDTAPNRLPGYTVAGLILAGLLALLGTGNDRASRAGFIALAGFLTLALGIIGTLMEFLWLFTAHDVTYLNENVLQANSLSLILFVLVFLMWRGKTLGNKTAVRVAMVIAGLSSLGFMIQVLPNFDQVNGEVIALLMPVHIAIAWVLSRRVLIFGTSPVVASEARKAA